VEGESKLMKILGFGRLAVGAGLALILLAGCSGSQGQIGGTGAMPQVGAPGASVSPQSKSRDLLYVSSSDRDNVYVFEFPKIDLIHILSGFMEPGPAGLCTDGDGNVYVTDPGTSGSGAVYVYAHGSTTGTATLSAPLGAQGCSYDPTTGNLAVVTAGGDLAIYANAGGNPTIYTFKEMSKFQYCAYDDSGNLFIDGSNDKSSPLVVFVNGSFKNVALNKKISPVNLQWNSGVLVASEADEGGSQKVYQLKISGTKAQVVGTIVLQRRNSAKLAYGAQNWIQSKILVAPGPNIGTLEFWHYPHGGEPAQKTSRGNGGYFFGIVVSVAGT
jgi:hypothetical protein